MKNEEKQLILELLKARTDLVCDRLFTCDYNSVKKNIRNARMARRKI